MGDTYDVQSRTRWYREDGQKPNLEQLTFGAVQRIADATELMAKNHDQLVRERDSARHDRDYWRGQAELQTRRLSAAKGQITKLKRLNPESQS